MDSQDAKAYLISRVQDLITHSQIRNFVFLALEQVAPDYIWEINASTSGENHGGETQTEHVLMALKLAEHAANILDHKEVAMRGTSLDTSLLYAIVALHDLFKCGKPGQVNTINGDLRTDHNHPQYVPTMLKNILVWDQDKKKHIKACETIWWDRFCDGVVNHGGPWTPYPISHSLMRALTDITLLGFMCDYFASRRGVKIEI